VRKTCASVRDAVGIVDFLGPLAHHDGHAAAPNERKLVCSGSDKLQGFGSGIFFGTSAQNGRRPRKNLFITRGSVQVHFEVVANFDVNVVLACYWCELKLGIRLEKFGTKHPRFDKSIKIRLAYGWFGSGVVEPPNEVFVLWVVFESFGRGQVKAAVS
jgi:hypothetical protein